MWPSLQARDTDTLDVWVDVHDLVDQLIDGPPSVLCRLRRENVLQRVAHIFVRVDAGAVRSPPLSKVASTFVGVGPDEDGNLDKLAIGDLIGEVIGNEVTIEDWNPIARSIAGVV